MGCYLVHTTPRRFRCESVRCLSARVCSCPVAPGPFWGLLALSSSQGTCSRPKKKHIGKHRFLHFVRFETERVGEGGGGGRISCGCIPQRACFTVLHFLFYFAYFHFSAFRDREGERVIAIVFSAHEARHAGLGGGGTLASNTGTAAS